MYSYCNVIIKIFSESWISNPKWNSPR